MKILYIHNEYARPSGEEFAASELVDLLRENGHEVRWFTRSSAEIEGSKIGRFKAFFAGVYNPFSAVSLAGVLDNFKPDIVHVQNIYPLLSVSIFRPVKKRGIPIVMRCPNYRLFCPSGLSLDSHGRVCECCWSGMRELNCIFKNCMGSNSKSFGYALRNIFARFSRIIRRNVDVFVVQTDFQKNKFVSQNVPSYRIAILPGISPNIKLHDEKNLGQWVSYVGRVSEEKGIDDFIEAARLNPAIPFRVAGDVSSEYHIPQPLPQNLEFVGFKKGDDLDRFFINSRLIIVPSRCYEGFPNVIVRGMLHHKPIVTTSIGAMQSIIDDGVNGLLVPPGDSQALADAIRTLYPQEDLCRKLGDNGARKAATQYSRDEIYKSLMSAYTRARRLSSASQI